MPIPQLMELELLLRLTYSFASIVDTVGLVDCLKASYLGLFLCLKFPQNPSKNVPFTRFQPCVSEPAQSEYYVCDILIVDQYHHHSSHELQHKIKPCKSMTTFSLCKNNTLGPFKAPGNFIIRYHPVEFFLLPLGATIIMVNYRVTKSAA